MNDLQHRVNDALSSRPETQLARDYYRCVEVFGFDHAATRGCLLALVREAWGDPNIYVRGGFVHSAREGSPEDDDCHVWHAKSEAEALVSALEAAP